MIPDLPIELIYRIKAFAGNPHGFQPDHGMKLKRTGKRSDHEAYQTVITGWSFMEQWVSDDKGTICGMVKRPMIIDDNINLPVKIESSKPSLPMFTNSARHTSSPALRLADDYDYDAIHKCRDGDWVLFVYCKNGSFYKLYKVKAI